MGLMPSGALFIVAVVFGPFLVCWYLALRLLAKHMILPAGTATDEVKRWCARIAVMVTLLAGWLFVACTGPGLFRLNAGMTLTSASVAVSTSWSNARRAPEAERRKFSGLLWYLLVAGALGIGAGYFAEHLLNSLFVDD